LGKDSAVGLNDFTSLGRPLDPKCPTNRAIATLALAVAFIWATIQLVSGAEVFESLLAGAAAAFTAFMAWALGRELDPDHDLSAFVGAGLGLIGLILFGTPSLLVVLWMLLLLRLVNRTSGLAARPLDSLAVLGLGIWLTWQGYWMAGLLTALGLLADGLLSRPLRYHLFLGGLTFGATAAILIFRGGAVKATGFATPVLVLLAVTVGLFLVVIATYGQVRSVGDVTNDPLDHRRVQAAQVLALLAGLLFAWPPGQSGVVALLPLWAAMSGAGIYRIVAWAVPTD
jgi:hypothetical protein